MKCENQSTNCLIIRRFTNDLKSQTLAPNLNRNYFRFPHKSSPSRLDVYGLVKILPSNLYLSHLFIYFCLDTSNVRGWVPYSHTPGPSFLPKKYSKYSESYGSVNHSLKTKKDKVTSLDPSMSCY